MSSEAAVCPEREAGDWRDKLPADSRQRIVNKITKTLRRHLPFSGEEGLQELNKIAVRFEEKIYTSAISQSDYLRKISLKMLTMEPRSQNPMANPLQLNTASNGENPSNRAWLLEKDSLEDDDNGGSISNPVANPLKPNKESNSENPQDPGQSAV